MTPAASPIERITLQSDSLKAVVLPELGGKIASLALLPWAGHAGGQLLQGPPKPYALRTPGMGFDQADGSGWDECLPSVGACTLDSEGLQHGGSELAVPDHGDFWRLAWKIEEQSEESLRMSATGTTFPIYFEKTVELDGERLLLDYFIRNDGAAPVPYLWSAHPLFAVEPGDRILLPQSVEEVTTEASGNGRLGEIGSRHAWPFTGDARDGSAIDLTTVGQPTDGVGDKIMTPAPKEGWCALERRSLGTRLTLRFDPKANPWLGLWICYGGWPDAVTARKGYTVALEPCTAPVDSLAVAVERGAARMLAPGEEQRWQLLLEVTPRAK